MKKNENKEMDEVNKRFNDTIKSLPQDYKPLDKSLLLHYHDAFIVHISYELRHEKPTYLKSA